jgi:general secretion pathway protein A
MYERFYNLRERPFALSPDPEYLYLSRVHSAALDSIRYGIESRAGFIVITGEIGAGKTTLLQSVLQRVDDRTTVARIVNTTLDPRELLEAIMLDFGLETTGKSKPALLRDLGQFLVQERTQGRRPLLVIDEAQNLSAQALEEVRLLSNLETEKSKLLQILLVGQPDLRSKIASTELEQFRQRVAVSYHLTPLDAPETAAYINYRLDHAAVGVAPHFPPDASALVHRRSGGVPRIINVICDATLVFGYAEERRQIDAALVHDVLDELETTGVLPRDPATPPAPDAASGAGSEEALRPVHTVGAAAHDEDPASLLPADVREQAIARAAREAEARAAALTAREQALAQRERELTEQRRVLMNEYRLLRTLRQQAPPRATAGAATGLRPTSSAAFVPTRAEGWRARLKRLFTGQRRRAVEGG